MQCSRPNTSTFFDTHRHTLDPFHLGDTHHLALAGGNKGGAVAPLITPRQPLRLSHWQLHPNEPRELLLRVGPFRLVMQS